MRAKEHVGRRLQNMVSRCCLLHFAQFRKDMKAWLSLFSIDGPYFNHFFLARELFQVGFQSWQAFRMSKHLPIAWLNRFNVVLLCLNCWSVPLLEMLVARWSDPATDHRLLMMLIDSCLDCLALTLMPLVVLAPYFQEFDYQLGMFPPVFWNNDLWLMRKLNEFQVVFIVSWGDAFSRFTSALMTLISLYVIQGMCQSRLRARTQCPQAEVRPSLPGIRRVGRSALVLWGSLVAFLHIYASALSTPDNCALVLRPWGVAKPACAAIVFNCYRSNVKGERHYLEPVFRAVSADFVYMILMRHCSALEMPRTLASHSRLINLSIHNATITEWGDHDTSALRGSYFETLNKLSFTRVNWTTEGELPLGIRPRDGVFPQSVQHISVLGSNLQTLPANLHEIWPQGLTLLFERCAFLHFPMTLSKINARFLSVVDNQLTNLPLSDLFGSDRNLVVLGASQNPVMSFDSEINVPESTELEVPPRMAWLSLFFTNITTLPDYLTTSEAFRTGRLSVLVGGSPLCHNASALPPAIDCTMAQSRTFPIDDLRRRDLLNPL